jgi:hypothetical protein
VGVQDGAGIVIFYGDDEIAPVRGQRRSVQFLPDIQLSDDGAMGRVNDGDQPLPTCHPNPILPIGIAHQHHAQQQAEPKTPHNFSRPEKKKACDLLCNNSSSEIKGLPELFYTFFQ